LLSAGDGKDGLAIEVDFTTLTLILSGIDLQSAEYIALNTQYLSLAQTINSTLSDRDAPKLKVIELEAINKRLTDMLWGHRSERRIDISISPLLNFGDDAQRCGDRIAHQSCNAHARREFAKAQSNDPVLATQMIAFYQQLYAVEYRGALLSSAERLELRQRDAVPTWQRMAKWLERDEVKRLLPKSEIAQAVGYLRNQWSALQLYLKDGNLPIDNNQSERVIRPLGSHPSTSRSS